MSRLVTKEMLLASLSLNDDEDETNNNNANTSTNNAYNQPQSPRSITSSSTTANTAKRRPYSEPIRPFSPTTTNRSVSNSSIAGFSAAQKLSILEALESDDDVEEENGKLGNSMNSTGRQSWATKSGNSPIRQQQRTTQQQLLLSPDNELDSASAFIPIDANQKSPVKTDLVVQDIESPVRSVTSSRPTTAQQQQQPPPPKSRQPSTSYATQLKLAQTMQSYRSYQNLTESEIIRLRQENEQLKKSTSQETLAALVAAANANANANGPASPSASGNYRPASAATMISTNLNSSFPSHQQQQQQQSSPIPPPTTSDLYHLQNTFQTFSTELLYEKERWQRKFMTQAVEMEELRKKLVEEREAKERVHDELEELRHGVDERCGGLLSKIHSLQDQLTTARKDYLQIKDVCETLGSNNEILQSERDDLLTRLEEARERKMRDDQDIKILAQKFKTALEYITELRSENESLRSELRAIQSSPQRKHSHNESVSIPPKSLRIDTVSPSPKSPSPKSPTRGGVLASTEASRARSRSTSPSPLPPPRSPSPKPPAKIVNSTTNSSLNEYNNQSVDLFLDDLGSGEYFKRVQYFEQVLRELTFERDQLLSSYNKLPASGGTGEIRRQRHHLEERLELVDQDVGRVKSVLRRMHVL